MENQEISFSQMQEIFKYSQVLQSGTLKLAKSATEIEKSIEDKNAFAVNLKSEFSSDLKALQNEVKVISDSVREVQKAMVILVSHMKSAVKRDEIIKLEKRIDAWGPHVLVNRNEVNKVLNSKQ